MRVDAVLVPCEFGGRPRPERVAVVVDVIRATTTIITAFEHGCRRILPTVTVDEAAAAQARHPGAVLCGERKGIRIDGFTLGNSPREFTERAVAGKNLILVTSNGTRTLRTVATGRDVAIGACLNRKAVAEWLYRRGEDALVICSGYEGVFSLEDAVCVGGIADCAVAMGAILGDGARACRALWARYGEDLRGLLAATAWGRHIVDIGLGDDLAICARLDTTAVVPVLRDGAITVDARA